MKKYETWKSGERLYIKFHDEPSGRIVQSLRSLGYAEVPGRQMTFSGIKDKAYVMERIQSWAGQREWRSNGERSGTLCWECGNAYGGCSWSRTFTPVEGWDAQYVRRVYKSKDAHILDSYEVHSCPEFVEDGR